FLEMVNRKQINEDWEDNQSSSMENWDDYLNNHFDPDDFVDWMLKDLIGSTVLVDAEDQENLDHYLATDEDVGRQISSYVSKETDGAIEDAGEAPEFLDLVYLTLEGRGINIPPMNKSPVKEV